MNDTKIKKRAQRGLVNVEPLNLEELQSKVIVREIQPKDFDSIVALQLSCFPGMKPWSKEQFDSQLAIFPKGQCCVEFDGEVVASSTSLIIDFEEYEQGHSWKEISDSGFITNHDPEGDTLYGIEIMVHPDYRAKKLARRLYDRRKALTRELNLRRIVVGGRIPGYTTFSSDFTPTQYVEKVMTRAVYDPVLTVQISNGFVLKRVIKSYLDSDKESSGYATLLEWVNLDYSPDTMKRFSHTKNARIALVQYQMREIKGFDDFAKQCEYFVDVSSNYKSNFVVFPEIFTMQLLSFLPNLDPAEAVREVASFTPQYVDLFSDLAIKYNVNIIGGTHFTQEGEQLVNIAYLFKRDGEIKKQYKLHITPNERRWWGVTPGNTVEVFQTDSGKIAILICYDVEFPELARVAVEQGAEIIFVPFCTDDRQGYLRVRYCAQARAIENQVYLCLAGCVGNLPFVENMDIHYAQSGIYTPSDFLFPRDGIAAESEANIETLVVEDIDLALLKRQRRKGSVRNWLDRRTDLYSIKWNKIEAHSG